MTTLPEITAQYLSSGMIEATIDGKTHTLVPSSTSFLARLLRAWEDEGNTIAPYTHIPTELELQEERNRRLEAGFPFDFGDERGVHTIGTTPSDMEGWDEVSKYTEALRAQGQGTTVINVVTNTGPASVAASEWPLVLIAAGEFRQPIWAAYFALLYQSPIPADFTSDIHWP
ncbi:hypothetical protein [Pyruvatibacter sp.]